MQRFPREEDSKKKWRDFSSPCITRNSNGPLNGPKKKKKLGKKNRG